MSYNFSAAKISSLVRFKKRNTSITTLKKRYIYVGYYNAGVVCSCKFWSRRIGSSWKAKSCEATKRKSNRLYVMQGCQIFIRTNIPKREKYNKWPQTIPNRHKLYQMAIKYSKWSWNIPTFTIQRPSKIYLHLGFLFENKPSGNPDVMYEDVWSSYNGIAAIEDVEIHYKHWTAHMAAGQNLELSKCIH
jgi:hypothetical protein